MFNVINTSYPTMQEAVRELDIKTVGGDQDSFTMIEAFGISYPAEWNITDEESKHFAFLALKSKLPDAFVTEKKFVDIDEAMWTKIKNAIENDLKSVIKESQFSDLLASTIYSLCRQGAYTRSTAENVTVSTSHGYNASLSPTGVASYWANLGKTCNQKCIAKVME
ncbi:unnamed protein product [Larinioides sclopetarius]|uniref:Uncharacterized protein n=1 Tax=Larinioides sclopetarius TaxID=280406 RepID=A0AAV2C036_9ARAC